MELTPGERAEPSRSPTAGRCRRARWRRPSSSTRSSAPSTPRRGAAFSSWLDQQGRAVDERGEALNDALGNLEPFADDAEDVLAILDRQEAATRGLVRDTGAVFEALTEREGQLRELVVNSNRVFETTAARDEALADTFTAFPTFLRETRADHAPHDRVRPRHQPADHPAAARRARSSRRR